MGELYLQYEYWVAALQLIFAMLGMGATLTIGDFKEVIRFPRSVTIGLVVQLIIVPLFAFVFIFAFDMHAGVAIGIALIAAIPGGTTSNIFTYLARGNAPLSISITGITTLACLIMTPLILSLLVTDYLPENFTMPSNKIISDIAFTLLLPLFIGMVILKYLPRHAGWLSRWSIRLSLLGVLLIIIGSSSAGRLDIDAFGIDNLLLILAFIVSLSLSIWVIGHLLTLSKSDATAIEMEVIVRNINLAVLINVSLFPATTDVNGIGNMVLFTILLYGALQMLIAAVFITARRYGINARKI